MNMLGQGMTTLDWIGTPNNLSYMLGGGYLFTGKYFKGTGDGNKVRNDYLIISKLTLAF